MTKKQLEARVKRLERKNRKLQNKVNVLYSALYQSVVMARELAQMVPPPNYDYAQGM